MPKASKNTQPEVEIDDLDAALADLETISDLDDAVIEEPVAEELDASAEVSQEEIVEALADEDDLTDLDLGAEVEETAIDDILDDDAISALDLAEAQEEAYESQETPEPVASVEDDEEPAAAPARTRRVSTPRAPKDLSALPDEAFVLTDEAPDDLAQNRIDLMARVPVTKKVVEKFDNAILSLHAGKLPSKYTADCYRLLKASGTISSKGLVDGLKATPLKSNSAETYSEGTARAQTGQIMALFPLLGIADRNKQELTLRADSALAKKLDALLGL